MKKAEVDSSLFFLRFSLVVFNKIPLVKMFYLNFFSKPIVNKLKKEKNAQHCFYFE